jgi:hypothetical protein
MDDGYVIPGLNENWTFAGAKPMEWMAGFVVMMIYVELFVTNMGKQMPIILMLLVLVPMGLATLRKTYPDEEKGVANHLMSVLGIAPPTIPKPSMLQPNWSGLPIKTIHRNKEFMSLGLDEFLFPEPGEEASSMEALMKAQRLRMEAENDNAIGVGIGSSAAQASLDAASDAAEETAGSSDDE